MFLSFCVFQDNGKEQEKRKNLLKTSWSSIPYKTWNSLHLFWCCNVLWPHKKHTQECYDTVYCTWMKAMKIQGIFIVTSTHNFISLFWLTTVLHHVPSMFSTFRLEWEYRPTFLWNFKFWLLQTIHHVCNNFWQNRQTLSTHTFAHLSDKKVSW